MSRRNATNDLPSSVSIPISVGMLPTKSPITDMERDAEKGQDQRVKEQNNIYRWMGRYTYVLSFESTPRNEGIVPHSDWVPRCNTSEVVCVRLLDRNMRKV